MTKRTGKNRQTAKRTKTQRQKTVSATKNKKQKTLVAFAIIIILAAIPFALGKYFEFNSPGPYDSGAYVYSARHILEGAKIGTEENPSARLGTLLMNILGVWLCGFNETGPKLVQMILQAAALLLMFIAMRKLFGTLSAAIALIIASAYLSAPLIAKFGNVKEQYFIAFMALGVSCFVLYQLGGRWWWAILAGAFVSWAPLFKETGTSAIGAIALFVIAQPLLKHRTLKQTGIDILLLLAGAAAALGPLYIWIIGWNVQLSLPYLFVWNTVQKFLPTTPAVGQVKAASGYLAKSRELVPFSKQWPIVLRYYGLLILPIGLAACSMAARIIRMIYMKVTTKKPQAKNYERFVLLFAVWWVLDMAFVWISPRSYDQYYLPLNASAAMLGGYIIALYYDKLSSAVNKNKLIAVGIGGLLLMIIMSWHIFFGIRTSPYSGQKYKDPDVRRGYAQTFKLISNRRKYNLIAPWEKTGKYIRINSEPKDKIYVWGWMPGIYVQAQRFAPSARASTMPRPAPAKLALEIEHLLVTFQKDRPKFIVDSRKRHVPMDRPPYELWPIAPKGFMGIKQSGFLPLNKDIIIAYDKWWSSGLREHFGDDEAIRYEAMQPFREFVMQNYERVEPTQNFWPHVIFKLK